METIQHDEADFSRVGLADAFTVFPGIYLRHGEVVRLAQGDPDQKTVYRTDPVATARDWIAQGAEWLHVINLDGALDEAGKTNWSLLPQICSLDAKVQFGGGIRQFSDIEWAFEHGMARVVLGTAAVEKPDMVVRAISTYGADRVIVSVDDDEGKVLTHGWRYDGGIETIAFGRQMRHLGVTTALHTNISRDGMLVGVGWKSSATLAQYTGLKVISSGGVASLDDIRYCYREPGICGVVIGRALYTGAIRLADVWHVGKTAVPAIAYIAINTGNAAGLADFYQSYFAAEVIDAGESSLAQIRLKLGGGAELHLLPHPNPVRVDVEGAQPLGLATFAISLGSVDRVNDVTMQLARDGYAVVSPSQWQNGRYTSIITDPDGNQITLTT